MEVLQIANQNKELYNTFVAQNNGSFLQSWEWGQWQEAQGRKVYRYISTVIPSGARNLDSSGRMHSHQNDVMLTAQFIEHTTPFGNYLYCPYGPVFQTGIMNNELGIMIESLLHQIQAEQPKLLFIRVEPRFPFVKTHNSKLIIYPSAHIQPDQTLLLDISKSTNDLLANFHPKTRYNIKVAEKHGVNIETFANVNKDVINLIMETSSRQKYRNHSREYIEKLWSFFAKHEGYVKVTGYLASANAKPVASGLMVDFANTRLYLFGGSNYELRELMAPYLLHWQVIQDAKQKNFTSYDLGASETASGNSGGFTRFKLGFSPTLIKFGGTFDIVNKPLPYALYKASRKLNRLLKHI